MAIRFHKKNGNGLKQDIFFLSCGIIAAVLFSKYGIVEMIYEKFVWSSILLSFIAGFFFTSVFTVATATVLISVASSHVDPLVLILFGSIGATCADILLFLFVKDRLMKDAEDSSRRLKKFRKVISKSFFNYLAPILGAIIIASPLPDEIGLSLMGFSKVKFRVFLLTAFLCNVVGIFAIVGITFLLK